MYRALMGRISTPSPWLRNVKTTNILRLSKVVPIARNRCSPWGFSSASRLDAKTVSQPHYRQYGQYDDTTVSRRFGSWNKALLAAGLALSNEVNISDERLFESILTLWQHFARQPRRRELAAAPSLIPKAHTIGALDHGQLHSKPSRHMPMHQEQKRRLATKLSKRGTLQVAIHQYGSVGRRCYAAGLLVADAAQVPLKSLALSFTSTM
jgi:hypothetical protein